MKKTGIILLVFVLAVVLSIIYLKDRGPLSEDKMRERFSCDRVTLEVLPTDKYCADYELYKKDHEAGRI